MTDSSQKIRIGLDARPLSTPMSGIGRLIHETLKAFPNHEQYEFYLYSHKPIHEAHKKLLDYSHLTWVQGEGLFSKKGGLYYNIALPLRIQKDNLSVFWGSQQVLPPFLPSNLPAVLTYLDLVLYLYPETMRPIARYQQRLFQSYSVRRSTHIMGISKQTVHDVVEKFKYPKEQTSVAYPGIDFEEIPRFLKTPITDRIQNIGSRYILSVSTIEPRKNYPFLLEVFRSIRKSNPELKLKWVIAGRRGWESDEFFKELDADISIYKDIIVLEGLNDSELHHLYKNSSLFWMASLYEGFGIPLLEALFHKRSCLVSDIETFHEIGSDSIPYISATSKKFIPEWRDKSLELLNSKNDTKSNISEFTWENSARIIQKVFQEAMKE